MRFSFKKSALPALAALVASAASANDASASVGFRAHGSLGAWNGGFSQNDAAGREVDIRTLTSLGMEFAAGLGLGLVFLEYNFTWFIPNHLLSFQQDPNAISRPSNREGPYFAPLGFNAGVHLPVLPIEPYLGAERGNFGFSTGATDFAGITGKLGVNVLVHPQIALRAEYRRLWISYDDAGKLPDGMSASFDAIYVGFAFGKF